jgi:UDP-N-acetylglucosamine 1-carboxyvinyltransferase
VEVLRVTGGARLAGEVRVGGAKNSALKLMAAALLAEGRTVLHDVPRILDVSIMAAVLRRLGCEVGHDPPDGTTYTITVPEQPTSAADYELVRRLRASICVLGPLVARTGEARVAFPGGDNIGSRPLDMHITGLQQLGAEVNVEHGYLVARAGQLAGTTLWLDFPSVGATENLLMAAVLAKGTTVIDNAAREPEITDICDMLAAMGAKINGAGTSTLEIEGVDALSPVEHTTVPDRIVAGTWAFGAAMTRGEVTVRNGRAAHLTTPLDKLVAAGAEVEVLDGAFRVRMDRRPRAVDVVTLPYPGLATDLLPMATALAAISDGSAMITENVFEARFNFAGELGRLGASLRTDGHHVLVRGRDQLSGAPVRAHDIRAGAALALAGLVAEGYTEVSELHHIDRGYPDFAADLRALGATVERVTRPDPAYGY